MMSTPQARNRGGGDDNYTGGVPADFSFSASSIIPKGEIDISEDEQYQFDQSQLQQTFDDTSFLQSTHQQADGGDDEFTTVQHLHNAFARAFFNMPSILQLFEVMDEWMIYVERALDIDRHFDPDIPEDVHNKLRKFLTKEYETWDLIKTLYFERLNTDNESTPFNDPINDPFHFDDLTYATAILKGDKGLREMDHIISWLELNHSRKGDPDLSYKAIAWEQTLETLKRDALLGRSSSNFVSQIDPDAPTRQRKELHPLDADEENRILRGTFHYLRTGSLDKAVSFLNQSGHIAKAKALLGQLLSQKEMMASNEVPEDDFIVLPGARHPTFSQPQEPIVMRRERLNFSVTGNPMRQLWKNVAWSICEQDGMSKWERAIIGVSCGHRRSMLDVANNWEDRLWSYLKSSVNVEVEKKLKALNRSSQTADHPPEYWSQGLNIHEVLDCLDNHEKREFTIDNMFQFLQKCVMENNIDGFLEELYTHIDSLFSNADHPAIMEQLTRFVAHVVLSFAIANLSYNESMTNLVCDAYINVLVKNGLFGSIPFYVQKLGAEHQIPVVISQIQPDKRYAFEEIKDFLHGSSESGLDVLGMAVAIVNKLREEVEDFDVDMLQWISCCLDLVENPSAVMFEYLRFTVLISRKYLTLGNLDKVKRLVKQINQECISTVEKLCPTLVREFVCYREYLEAEDVLSLWKQAKTQRPFMDHILPDSPHYTSLNDRALYEKKKREFDNNHAKWENAVHFHGKGAIDAFMKILKFPDGGWLRGCCNEADEDEAVQINSVRRIIMKKITFLLLNLVKDRNSAETFREFIYVLCDDQRRILEEFTAEEIGSIFRVVEEFHRKSNPDLAMRPTS